MTSDDFWHLETLPKRAVLIGGGYIATELSGVLNGLGAETTLLVRGGRLLQSFDVRGPSHCFVRGYTR